MLVVELDYLADIFDATGQAGNVSELARHYSGVISNAIWETTVCFFALITVIVLTQTGSVVK